MVVHEIPFRENIFFRTCACVSHTVRVAYCRIDVCSSKRRVGISSIGRNVASSIARTRPVFETYSRYKLSERWHATRLRVARYTIRGRSAQRVQESRAKRSRVARYAIRDRSALRVQESRRYAIRDRTLRGKGWRATR